VKAIHCGARIRIIVGSNIHNEILIPQATNNYYVLVYL